VWTRSTTSPFGRSSKKSERSGLTDKRRTGRAPTDLSEPGALQPSARTANADRVVGDQRRAWRDLARRKQQQQHLIRIGDSGRSAPVRLIGVAARRQQQRASACTLRPRTAQWHGVNMSAGPPVALMFAPAPISLASTSVWPFVAATWHGVRPLASARSTSTPLTSNSSAMTLSFLFAAARTHVVAPCWSTGVATSAPASIRSARAAALSLVAAT
jgi:hypothetical protein